MKRILIDMHYADEVEDVLDDMGIDYDWDSDGSLLLYPEDLDDATEALYAAGFDYDIIG